MMQPVQRTAARSVRQLRPQLQRQSRRHASDSSKGVHGAQDAHHAAPVNESFGAGFWMSLAAVPFGVAVYQYTNADGNSYFTRTISDTYLDYKAKFAQRNELHTTAMEQAAADRVLFLNETPKQPRWVDLRFPEQFNTGSPWNVPAGQGSVNIDKVIEKYQNEANEAQERKLQQLRENNVPIEQPYKSYVRKNVPDA